LLFFFAGLRRSKTRGGVPGRRTGPGSSLQPKGWWKTGNTRSGRFFCEGGDRKRAPAGSSFASWRGDGPKPGADRGALAHALASSLIFILLRFVVLFCCLIRFFSSERCHPLGRPVGRLGSPFSLTGARGQGPTAWGERAGGKRPRSFGQKTLARTGRVGSPLAVSDWAGGGGGGVFRGFVVRGQNTAVFFGGPLKPTRMAGGHPFWQTETQPAGLRRGFGPNIVIVIYRPGPRGRPNHPPPPPHTPPHREDFQFTFREGGGGAKRTRPRIEFPAPAGLIFQQGDRVR